jgi:predicted RNA-binding protein with PUA-like domain
MNRKYWLMKSEAESFSFADLCHAPQKTTCWDGVRNYQARNFMRDEMKKGDLVLFYHSNTKPPHVAGFAQIVSEKAYPDHTAFDLQSKYYDEKSKKDAPRWFMVDIQALCACKQIVTLDAVRDNPLCSEMPLIQRGQRLSVQPVQKHEFDVILSMSKTTLPKH